MKDSENLNDFHIELKERHSCLRTAVLGFLVLLVVLGVAGGLAWAQIGFRKDPETLVSPASHAGDQGVLTKLATRFTSPEVSKNSEQTITLSEEELNAVVHQAEPRASVTIKSEALVVTTPIQTQFGETIITVNLLPQVADGHLVLHLTMAKLGKLAAPRWILALVEQSIETGLVNQAALTKQVRIEEITLGEHEITLRGQIPESVMKDLTKTSPQAG